MTLPRTHRRAASDGLAGAASLPRMSHSRYQDYVDCGEAYRLKRIERVPRTPSIFAIAGSIFHSWTDEYDSNPARPDVADEAWFETELTKAVAAAEEESGFPLKEWDTPNKRPDSNVKQLAKFRDELGPDMIAKYKVWREETGWNIALGEYGRPGIELEVRYRVGDVDDIAVIDRIFDTPQGLVAIDTKTWARQRLTAQLPTYLVALRQTGLNVSGAAYYEARKGEHTEIKAYKYWDEARLAALHEQAARGIEAGFFVPRISDDCHMCDVKRHCIYIP